MNLEEKLGFFKNPNNMGAIEQADGEGLVGTPDCGEMMKITLKIEGDRIVDAKFSTFGCGAAISTSATVTELIKGKTVDEALTVGSKVVAQALIGAPPVKKHCSMLTQDALKAAIDDYLQKKKAKHPEA